MITNEVKIFKLIIVSLFSLMNLSVVFNTYGNDLEVNNYEDVCTKYEKMAILMSKEIKKLLRGVNVKCACSKDEPWKYPVVCTIKCKGSDPRILHDYQVVGKKAAIHFSRKKDFNYIIQVVNESMPIAIFFYTKEFDYIDEVYPWR